jgi:UMF1 family MFS transporter
MTDRNDKRTIFGWAMYDWANSAYITVFGAIIGAFFVETIMSGDTYWGLSGEVLFSFLIGFGSLILLVAMPILGAIADYTDSKRRMLRNFAFAGALFVLIAPFTPAGQVPLFLLLVILSQFGFVAANVFYDGFLPDIVTDDTIDRVSSKGFALGYLGGGLYLALAIVLIFAGSEDMVSGLSEELAQRAAIFGSGIWWIGFSLFALSRLPRDSEATNTDLTLGEFAKIGFNRTLDTTRKLRGFPHLLLFVVAFIIYNSGIGTVIAVSGPYAKDTLELGIITIAGAFLLVQFIAFVGALLFGALSDRIGPKSSILIALVVWTMIAGAAYFIPTGSEAGFLGLAAAVGFVLGGVQALSRSLYGSMIPEAASAEFFGFYSVFSKLSGFGPIIFGLVAWMSGSGRYGILSVAAFFLVGMLLLAKVDVEAARASRQQWDFENVGGSTTER